MDFHQLLVDRRSIRRYTNEKIDPESVKLILEAGLLAPTSKSSRAWQFVVVEDETMLMRLSECKPMGATPIARCPLAIVVAVDSTATEPWIEDASVAASYMQLQAAALGLGSCWIQIRDRYAADGMPSDEYIREALGIPETCPVVCVLTFGHKDEERKPQDVGKLKWENVHIDKF
ncbi:MAG: nitroreductase family protein [Staphylococcus sp.]|nr:nitroreductase family protein [Staphylococcus sp.]